MQRADVRGRAADIDDDRLGDAGEKRGAANRIGRPAGEGEHRKPLGIGGVHQRAVVLGQEEPPLDAAGVERGSKRVDDELGEIAQARVHHRRVLALQQPDAADVARQSDVDARQRLFEDRSGLGFELGVDRTEHRRDRDRANALGSDVLGDAEQFGLVERRNHASVELVPAMREIGMVSDRASEVLRPIDHRRQRGGGRQAEAHGGGRREIAALHHGIGEMGGADHDDVDRPGLHSRSREHGIQRRHHARHHVRRRRLLDACENLGSVHDDRVSIGAADVDAYPDHHALSRLDICICDMAPDVAAFSSAGPGPNK